MYHGGEMSRFADNLAIQFSVVSFVIMTLLAIGIAVFLTTSLNRNIELLQQHGTVMRAQKPPPITAHTMPGHTLSHQKIKDTDPFSIASLTRNVDRLRWQTLGVLCLGFTLLYGALVAIVWRGWGLLQRQQIALASANKDLQEAQAVTAAANQAKSMFLANMSHELRTPLHGILSFSNLGLEKAVTTSPERLQNYFEKIGQSGQTLLDLLDNLLDLTKLEAGKTVFSFETTDLRLLATQVVEEFDALSIERNLTVEVLSDETLPEVVLDVDKLRQVCRNLLSNAVKFSPDDGIITCHLHYEPGAETVVVSISDEGVGIPEDELSTIFDKFVQSSKTRTNAGGTGLGLAICREIIAAHAGSIWAENRPDGGAVFYLSLPVQVENLMAVVRPAATETVKFPSTL